MAFYLGGKISVGTDLFAKGGNGNESRHQVYRHGCAQGSDCDRGPDVNDPTTAVQALDQIEDLLRRLGSRRLEIGAVRDSKGKLRLVIPRPAWDDFLLLAFEEIRGYGANSLQVTRRMNALISDLILALPEERHKPLRHYQQRMDATIAKSFENTEERREACVEDRQGLGSPRTRPLN